ncbi:MAG: hypothetical protein ACK504_05595 [Bacteroidota bacterium]
MEINFKDNFISKFTDNNLQNYLPVNYYFLLPMESRPEQIEDETSIFHNNKSYYCGLSVKPISKCISFKKINNGNGF